VHRQPVNSSSILSIGYDAGASALEIEFAGGGLYRYFMIGANMYRRLIEAPSKGAFVNEHIRDRYPCERLRKSFPPRD
jgi:hypothetical protein